MLAVCAADRTDRTVQSGRVQSASADAIGSAMVPAVKPAKRSGGEHADDSAAHGGCEKSAFVTPLSGPCMSPDAMGLNPHYVRARIWIEDLRRSDLQWDVLVPTASRGRLGESLGQLAAGV